MSRSAHLDPVVSGHHGSGPWWPLLQLAHAAGRVIRRGQHQKLAVREEAQEAIVAHHVPRTVVEVLVTVGLAGADVGGAADVAPGELQVRPGEVQLAPHGRYARLRAARTQHPVRGTEQAVLIRGGRLVHSQLPTMSALLTAPRSSQCERVRIMKDSHHYCERIERKAWRLTVGRCVSRWRCLWPAGRSRGRQAPAGPESGHRALRRPPSRRSAASPRPADSRCVPPVRRYSTQVHRAVTRRLNVLSRGTE